MWFGFFVTHGHMCVTFIPFFYVDHCTVFNTMTCALDFVTNDRAYIEKKSTWKSILRFFTFDKKATLFSVLSPVLLLICQVYY